MPGGGYVVGYDYNVHSSIEYHCDAGHVLRGEPIHQCMNSGEWSGDPPACECKTCILHQFFPHHFFATPHPFVASEFCGISESDAVL